MRHPEAVPEQPLSLTIEVIRWIEVLDVAQELVRQQYGCSWDELRAQVEESGGDYTPLVALVGQAKEIVGEKIDVSLAYLAWREGKKAGLIKDPYLSWARQQRQSPSSQ